MLDQVGMESVKSRLVAIRPQIERMLSIGGTVGLSYGVIHHGKVVHLESFGYRDLEKKLPPNEDTIFPICSMSKGLVTSTLGTIVEDGKLEWNTPLHCLLPDYKPKSEFLRASGTLVDWLSMRSGTESYQPWFQSENHIIFPESDGMKIVNNLHPVADLRTRFRYSNWGWEIAARVIRQLTGHTWDSVLHSRILEPLGLNRTDARGNFADYDNVTESYTVLDDRTPIHIPITPMSGKTVLGAAGGVKSCVKDLLTLYHALLQAGVDQFEHSKTSTTGSPFKQLSYILSAHMPLPGPSLRESTYGLGFLRTQLPNIMCKISPNLDQLGEEPILGDGAPSKLLWAHYGSMPGAYCGVNMFPETESVIVVLTNTTPMCDMSDWVIQLITQELFDFPKKHDYVHWTQKTVDHELGWHDRLKCELEEAKEHGTSPRDLHDYTGTYCNAPGYFSIRVELHDKKLKMALQSRDDETYTLEHYEKDAFSWLLPRNDLVERGRWVLQPASFYVIRFHTNEDGKVDRLAWANDPEVPEGEQFWKVDPKESVNATEASSSRGSSFPMIASLFRH